MANFTGRSKPIQYLFQNGGGGGSCKVISGYYHDGDFYEDQSYTQIITGSEDSLYIDLDTTTLYLFDGTDYVEVQGGGGSGGGSFACDLLFENTNLTPASGSTSVTKDYTLIASIDSYDAVLVMGYVFVNNSGVGNIASLLIAKSDYYARCTSQTDTVAWAYILNGSIPTGDNTRRLCFGFSDSTHIRTLSTRVSNEEPMLYKVYGLNFGGTAHTYTTTEQLVGTWIDGKPIYEKTIEFPFDSSWCGHRNVITHGIADIETPVNMVGRRYATGYTSFVASQNRPSNDDYLSRSATMFANTIIEFMIFERTDFIVAVGGAYAEYPFQSLIVTFQYTKTTD